MGSATSVLKFPSHSPLGISDPGDLPPESPYRLGRARPTARCAYPPVFPITDSGLPVVSEFPPIVHRLRYTPRLRSRLTLGGRAFPRKPQASGGQDSHLPSRLLIPAFSLPYAPQHLTVLLRRIRNAPLPSRKSETGCQRSDKDFLVHFVIRVYSCLLKDSYLPLISSWCS